MSRNGRGAAEWGRLVDQWRQSGLSLPAFCQLHGIKKNTMSGWVYKPSLKRAIENARQSQDIRDQAPVPTRSVPASKPSPAFVPVRLRELVTSPTAKPIPCPAIEVKLRTGRRVIVPCGFDSETLRQVVAVLED